MREDLDEVLAKAKKQTSISTTGPMRKVLIEALRAFEDSDSPAKAYARALSDWYYNRQENSKRGALREIKSDTVEIKGDVNELLTIMARLEMELAAVKRAISMRYDVAVADGCDSVKDIE